MIGLKKSIWLFAAICGTPAVPAYSSIVAVIDSGIDTKHEKLSDQIWLNPSDNSINRRDEDENGFMDDVNGWNFANNNHKLIDYRYGDLFNDDVERFFKIQTLSLQGLANEEDLNWAKNKVNDSTFRKSIITYGNYAHGTHVAGITAELSPESQVIGIKLIPTENPFLQLYMQVEQAKREGKSINWILKQVIKGGLFLFAKAQSVIFSQVGTYLNGHQVDIANASLGVGPTQARMIIRPLLTFAMGGQSPSDELVDDFARFFLNRVLEEQKSMMKQAPNTLFVFAAGNDSSNNDNLPTAPASIRHPHVISVAATYLDGRLAPFSNWGQSVDIAAPGIGISSSIPNNRYLELSGTSQAAPLVASVAAEIKVINPDLKADQIKSIIMKTVDRRDDLAEKVKSGGLLNERRALEAARLSLELNLTEAIAESLSAVSDQERIRIVTEVPEKPFYFEFRPSLLF